MTRLGKIQGPSREAQTVLSVHRVFLSVCLHRLDSLRLGLCHVFIIARELYDSTKTGRGLYHSFVKGREMWRGADTRNIMSARLGSFLFTPNTVMVSLAAGFFWVLTFRRIYPALTSSRTIVAFILLAGSGVGVGLGILHARIAGAPGLYDAFGLHLGSLGGYGGTILGMLLISRLLRLNTAKIADACIPGIAAGGIVSRIGCLFTGCCRGYAGFMHLWPFYDIAALAAALGISQFATLPGRRAAFFFLFYGALRFFLEFARPSVFFYGPLSINAALALILAGIAAVYLLRK